MADETDDTEADACGNVAEGAGSAWDEMRLKISSAGSRPSCLGLNELMFIDCKGIVDYVCDCCVYINAMISLFHICLTH